MYPNGNLTDAASCNLLGLSPLGETLIQALMDKGMIIDVDHMSNKSIDRTLTLAEGRSYPVVATHVQFFDLYQQHFMGNRGRHERMRRAAQLQRIKGVGGMITAMLKDDVQDTDGKGEKDTIDSYGGLVNDCRHSSKALAQAYKYAVDKMGGPVVFGSDFNGVAGHVGPRFGSNACGEDDTEEFQQ